ncbi:DUF269 domain-containing protein [Seleniivibrio woodruffii]|uniref:Putative nitrogen fixation protein n=1 Tax=Seleniivibrio woodruffii TaxID=1078050 RepID=A0A4R1KDW6_9BACT|nr:DUF269 domain-containing protein [Seleniivibrio woodruffii]TCK62260.1 putative nitrogen fixation protein [Seleniivibrio woodruffii]TVZ34622.1 putative nitrogen fixation protein [Seleniivibrio woodruffii]
MARSFRDVLITKIRSHDPHNIWKNVADDTLITRYYVVTKEEKKKIDAFKAISPETVAKIRLYYETVALAVEESCGQMIITVLDINTEGFGRALLIYEDFILLQKFHRNAHKFGFATLEEVLEEGEKLVAKTLENAGRLGVIPA